MNSFLTIDIGNTHIAAGVFEDDKIVGRCRIASDRGRTSDEFGLLLKQTLQEKGLAGFDLDAAIICSVVPGLTPRAEKGVLAFFGVKPYSVIPENYEKLGITVRYDNVEEVGPDRVVNALAAQELYGVPAVVVDFGTATTFDIIASDGAYIGGVIMPGPRVSAETLFSRAARLSPVAFVKPERVIGANTEQAMQAGIMLGTIDAVEGMLNRIYSELGEKPITIATGGFAETLQPYIPSISKADKDLTLRGLAIVYERINNGLS